MMVRAAISDPLPLLRTGIAAALRRDGHPVDEPADVLAWCSDEAPVLIVIGLTTPAQWELLSDLGRSRPAARIVALLPDAAAATRAVRAGATAVLPRDVTAERLLEACRAVRRDESVLPAATVRELLRRAARWDDDVRLDDRELGWLRMLAGGATVARVAAQSGYSERMMFRLLRDLYARLGVGGRTEAMLLAREQGWV
ncbi:DNA-binding NarL/FixJ family response regulator [Micromonospora profundi]|uniref:response regulator transcription factor n=1 Tax=Micromonospora profundi TaxID=1420889 RepID=UPI00143A7DC4|nr:response regulator transcription factor [Micromonospora profundi]NJC12998.1 DNA-binding NarL/FixJ family response regulator [Micromonospora profundi]